MTKGQVSLAQSENLSRHVHQSKSILQVSEDRRILSKKHCLLQLGISSLHSVKGGASIRREQSRAIIPLLKVCGNCQLHHWQSTT